MKVTFMTGLPGLSGRYREIVYCRDKVSGTYYARRNTYPELSVENERIGSISSRLFQIKPSEGFKADMRRYLDSYNSLRVNREKPMRSWSALYIRMMYEMARQDPGIDLRNLSRQSIFELDLPCKSIKRAVEAGILPQTEFWEIYTQEI